MSNADLIAAAIVAASRETGACPVRVLTGGNDEQLEPPVYETSRARAYAAVAIHATLPEYGVVQIGRMLGSRSPAVYLSELNKRRAKTKWWRDEVLDRVKAAIRSQEGYRSRDVRPAPTQRAAALSLPRPAASAGKHDLLRELRDAVRNTAALPLPED
jgi:hypothetical protein